MKKSKVIFVFIAAVFYDNFKYLFTENTYNFDCISKHLKVLEIGN